MLKVWCFKLQTAKNPSHCCNGFFLFEVCALVITKTLSTKRRFAQETLRFRKGNTEYYFSINVKKFSELSFIVFEACGLRNVLVSTAVESQNTVHKEALCSTDATL
jgi:hypothetical protein